MRRLIATLVTAVFTITALGAAAGPVHAAADTSTIEPAAVPGTVTVDDLSDGFRRTGSGWRSATGGWDDHHYWVPAKRQLSRIGIWTTTFDEPGLYRVLAKLPRWHANSRKAVYKLKTTGGWVKRVRNQYKSKGGWLSLGTHAFTTGAEVRLFDKTLDPRGSGRKVAFDAVRFIPIEPPEPPVITRLDVEPKHDRAIVTFSLAEKGPARTKYREKGDSGWTLGAEETSSKYADHVQTIRDLRPETDYEARVVATNAVGKTVSDIKRFTTLPRTVDCNSGGSLQTALNQAKSGDTITIKGKCVGNFKAGESGGSLTLRGDGAQLAASGSTNPVLETKGAVIIKSLIISGGYYGIKANGRDPITVVDSTIRGTRGSGIRNDQGSLTMRSSVVRNNGGVGLATGFDDRCEQTVSISDSTISGNGGNGIQGGADVTITDSLVTANGEAGIWYVGGLCDLAELALIRTRITDHGRSGIRNWNGNSAEIRASTITGNETSGVGGGIHNVGELVLIDTEVTKNTATDGGGIYNTGVVTIQGSTIENNTPNDCVNAEGGTGC